MALDLTQQQKETGRANFQRSADGLTRRGFLKSMAVGGAVVAPVAAATYFGYKASAVKGNPVRTALIGTGDEGGVLLGEHNPEFLKIVAVCDIRPTNIRRIFTGDMDVKPDGTEFYKGNIRKGLDKIYGDEAKTIKQETDYKKILEDKNIEAVIIALPLCWHAKVAVEAMKAGKHVLCEKLMGWNVAQSKAMARTAADKDIDKILSIGHQRHYSMLYAHAKEVMHSGVLGEVRHIRALWHRNNSEPYDKGKKEKHQKNDWYKWAANVPQPKYKDSWYKEVHEKDYETLKGEVEKYGFKDVPELIRWRLFQETGGGLMAELGSHQLDACSIFLGHNDPETGEFHPVHPVAVSGVGGRYFYRSDPAANYIDDRDIADHVFCTFEFPGENHAKDKDDKVIVTYSSINTNDFEPYGECVMGNSGTLLVEGEKLAMLYAKDDRSLAVSVGGGSGPVIDTSGSATGAVLSSPQAALGQVSRGYREEMEHFAYCIRMRDQGMEKDKKKLRPRCDGPTALADGVMALAANAAMARNERIVFQEEWFDPMSDKLPEWDGKARPAFDVPLGG